MQWHFHRVIGLKWRFLFWGCLRWALDTQNRPQTVYPGAPKGRTPRGRFPCNRLVEAESRKKLGHRDAVFVDNFGQCVVLLSIPKILAHAPSVFCTVCVEFRTHFFEIKKTDFYIGLCPLQTRYHIAGFKKTNPGPRSKRPSAWLLCHGTDKIPCEYIEQKIRFCQSFEHEK